MDAGTAVVLLGFGSAVAQGVTVFQNEWCFCIMPTIVPENPPSAASVAYGAAALPRGGLLLAGAEPRPGRGAGWRVTALGADGSVTWTRSLCRAEDWHEVARAAAASADGRAVVAGYSEHARGTPVPARWLVEAYGPDGATLWADDEPASRTQRAEAVALAPDGGAVAAGWRGTGGGAGSCWLVKAYDLMGAVRWTFTLAGVVAGPSGARAVAAGADGRIVVAGNLMAGGGPQSAWDVHVLGADGRIAWSWSRLGAASWLDGPYGVAVSPAGRIAVVGKTAGPPGEKANWTVTMLDAGGRELWTRTSNGARSLDDKAHAVVFDRCGRVVVAGYEDGDTGQKAPFDAGHWMVRTYEPDGADAGGRDGLSLHVAPGGAYALAPAADGSIAVAGYEQEAEPGRTKWAVRRLDPPRCP